MVHKRFARIKILLHHNPPFTFETKNNTALKKQSSHVINTYPQNLRTYVNNSRHILAIIFLMFKGHSSASILVKQKKIHKISHNRLIVKLIKMQKKGYYKFMNAPFHSKRKENFTSQNPPTMSTNYPR